MLSCGNKDFFQVYFSYVLYLVDSSHSANSWNRSAVMKDDRALLDNLWFQKIYLIST